MDRFSLGLEACSTSTAMETVWAARLAWPAPSCVAAVLRGSGPSPMRDGQEKGRCHGEPQAVWRKVPSSQRLKIMCKGRSRRWTDTSRYDGSSRGRKMVGRMRWT